MSTSTFLKIVSFCVEKYDSMNASCPPQSQRFKIKLPTKRTYDCSTSTRNKRVDFEEERAFDERTCGTETSGIFSTVVSEDDRAHRGLSSATLAHQENLTRRRRIGASLAMEDDLYLLSHHLLGGISTERTNVDLDCHSEKVFR